MGGHGRARAGTGGHGRHGRARAGTGGHFTSAHSDTAGTSPAPTVTRRAESDRGATDVMKVASSLPTDESLPVPQLAREVEDRAITRSGCRITRTSRPRDEHRRGRKTSRPLPEEYRRNLDPSRAGGRSRRDSRIELGTGCAWWRNATRSGRPKRSPRSTSCPTAGSASGSASAGIARRWRTTGSTSPPGAPGSGAHPGHARAVDQ